GPPCLGTPPHAADPLDVPRFDGRRGQGGPNPPEVLTRRPPAETGLTGVVRTSHERPVPGSRGAASASGSRSAGGSQRRRSRRLRGSRPGVGIGAASCHTRNVMHRRFEALFPTALITALLLPSVLVTAVCLGTATLWPTDPPPALRGSVVVWGDRAFTTRRGFEMWLEANGRKYGRGGQKHPTARAGVRTSPRG